VPIGAVERLDGVDFGSGRSAKHAADGLVGAPVAELRQNIELADRSVRGRDVSIWVQILEIVNIISHSLQLCLISFMNIANYFLEYITNIF